MVVDFTQQFAGGVTSHTEFFITEGKLLRVHDKKRSKAAAVLTENKQAFESKLAALSSVHDCCVFWQQDAWRCVPETVDSE